MTKKLESRGAEIGPTPKLIANRGSNVDSSRVVGLGMTERFPFCSFDRPPFQCLSFDD